MLVQPSLIITECHYNVFLFCFLHAGLFCMIFVTRGHKAKLFSKMICPFSNICFENLRFMGGLVRFHRHSWHMMLCQQNIENVVPTKSGLMLSPLQQFHVRRGGILVWSKVRNLPYSLKVHLLFYLKMFFLFIYK